MEATGSLHEIEARVRGVVARAAIDPVFQPIADLRSGEVVGFEALSRFRDPGDRTPADWFSDAAAVGLGVELELTAMRAALTHMDEMVQGHYMALNVSPELALSPRLLDALDGVPLDRVVIEITEHSPVDDSDELKRALAGLRARGLRLAIDDVGAGFASMSLILHLHPDVIKLDIDLTRGIDQDPDRCALIASLVTFARAIGCRVVAEGIETEEEARALLDLGVHSGQGYLLGRPGAPSMLPTTMRDARRPPSGAFGIAAHVSALVDIASSRATYEPQRSRRGAARAAVVVIAAALALGSTTVAMAGTAGPDSPLWWVKLRVEDARLALERDPGRRALLLAEFAERRVNELEALPGDARSGRSADVMARYAALTDRLGLLVSSGGASMRTVADRLDVALKQQQDAIAAMVRSSCADAGGGCSSLRKGARAATGAASEVAARLGGGGDDDRPSKPTDPRRSGTAKGGPARGGPAEKPTTVEVGPVEAGPVKTGPVGAGRDNGRAKVEVGP